MSLERQENKENPWWGEHVHRYREACKCIPENSRILDIACGSGFGSLLLGKIKNSQVTGADISAEAIEHCNKVHHESNIRFEIADGTALTYPDEYFDAVVSFETIEHTTQYEQMLKEFKRVLKPTGLLILSTPNFPVNSPKGIIENPYHTQEFTYGELETVLKRTFSRVEISGQKYIRYKITTPVMKLGKWVEHCFYKRGIRKLPMFLQNAVMLMLTGKKQYPGADDFEMVTEKEEALTCKTFFVICRK